MGIRRDWQTAFALGAVLLACSIPAYTQVDQVSVIEAPVIRLAASSHAGTARLRLRSTTTERVLLTVGPLVDVATKEVLPAIVVLAEASSKASDFDATQNQIHDVTVTASKVFFEGEAQAPILNKNVKIGDLQIVRAAFAVNLVNDSPVVFRENSATAIPIRNDSRDGYRVGWMMQIGPNKYCGAHTNSCDDARNWATVTLQPKERAVLTVTPPAGWFRSALPGVFTYVDAFRRRVEDATLWLALADETPKRALTLEADLSGRYYVELAWIVGLLTLGASMSLLVRYWVPNMQRKRDLKDQMRRIRGKIYGISTEIDSTLRALVLVQLNLLDALRKSTVTFLPDYATVATLCAQAAAVLERRVDMIEEVDSTYEQTAAKWERCPPPSQVDEVDALLRSAADVLRKPQPGEADFLNARKLIDQSRGINERMGTDDEDFGKRLASRLDTLRAEMKRLRDQKPNDAYMRLKNALPGMFHRLDADSNGAPPAAQDGEAPAQNDEAVPPSKPIPSQQHSLVDYDLCALTIVRDYIWLYEGSADATFRGRISEVEPRLICHLSRKSWNELRLANLALKEFREDSSEAQVLAAIEGGKSQMFLEQEPKGSLVGPGLLTVYPRQLVQFRAHFRQSELNWSAARENFSCVWDFGDGHRDERGWSASHFFPDVRISRWLRLWLTIRGWFGTSEEQRAASGAWKRYSVRVEFKDRSGKQVASSLEPLQVEVRPDPNDDRRTRSVSEVVGLLVSIAVPFLALIAGARDQLAQNPTGAAMTVFLLGYSSESIISVFKQRASPQ